MTVNQLNQSSHVDLRIQGEPEQSPDNEDQEKDITDEVVGDTGFCISKNHMMAELFPKNDDRENQDISEDFNNIVKEQGNIEADEMYMITDAILCQTCYHYETPGHTHCTCGQANPGASGEVKEQVSQKAS